MEPFDDVDLVRKLQIQKGAQVYEGEVAYLVRSLIGAVGEDPNREGLLKTPERVSRMFDELLKGNQITLEQVVNDAIFDSDFTGMVLVKDIEFYSLCEHHLLPFFGKVHVAYTPDGKVIGLSKIPRIVEMFARRLQLQERMTQQIAEALEEAVHPKGIAIVVEGAHMCSIMRGVKKTEARMVTSVMLGQFKEDEKLRSEFMDNIKRVQD